KPQRVNARRVGRQHQTNDGTLHLETGRNLALYPEAIREHASVEAAGQRRENPSHLGEDEFVLLHVRPRHSLRQTGGCRPGPPDPPGGLWAAAHRERGSLVAPARRADATDQLFEGDVAGDVPRALSLACVARDEPAVGPAHSRDRLAGGEVNDLVDLEARVGLP